MSPLLLLGMALLVFANRYLLLEPRLPLRLGRRLRDFLDFAAPGMLSALCAPILFAARDDGASLPYLLAGLAAVALVLWTGRVLTTVVASLLLFYLLRAWP